jgi:hypothetical protein
MSKGLALYDAAKDNKVDELSKLLQQCSQDDVNWQNPEVVINYSRDRGIGKVFWV